MNSVKQQTLTLHLVVTPWVEVVALGHGGTCHPAVPSRAYGGMPAPLCARAASRGSAQIV